MTPQTSSETHLDRVTVRCPVTLGVLHDILERLDELTEGDAIVTVKGTSLVITG